MPATGAVQGDCERVYMTTMQGANIVDKNYGIWWVG